MTWIIVGGLAVAALVLLFSLIKKLIKLAFTGLLLLLVVGAIWYFWQRHPEVSTTLQEVGSEAAEQLEAVAGELAEEAAVVVREEAERALDKAAQAVEDEVIGALEEPTEETVPQQSTEEPSTGEAEPPPLDKAVD